MNKKKDFLLIIKTEGDVWTDLSPEQLQEHIKHGTAYIGQLVKDGVMKSAAPVDKGGRVIRKIEGGLKDGPFNESKEVVAGYYLLVANDINEAIDIAKRNPIFNDIKTSIEVYPMMSL